MARRRSVIVLALLVLLAPACNGDGATDESGGGGKLPAGEKVRLGGVFPQTGDLADKSSVQGLELAVLEANRAGGIVFEGKRHEVELFLEDDAADAAQSVAKAKKLVDDDHVSAIIGPSLSRLAIPVAEQVAEASKVPVVSPGSTNPDFTKDKKYAFRVSFLDPFQGTVLASFAAKDLSAKKAATLTERGDVYSESLVAAFTESFEKAGGSVVSAQSYDKGQADLAPLAQAVNTAAPDVVLVAGHGQDNANAIAALRAAGLKAPLLGGDSWSPSELEAASVEATDSYSLAQWSDDIDQAGARAFIDAYKEEYGDAPDQYAAATYDAVNLVLAAMKAAESSSPEAVRDALSDTGGFDGVTGTISFEGSGDPLKSGIILEYSSGGAHFKKFAES